MVLHIQIYKQLKRLHIYFTPFYLSCLVTFVRSNLSHLPFAERFFKSAFFSKGPWGKITQCRLQGWINCQIVDLCLFMPDAKSEPFWCYTRLYIVRYKWCILKCVCMDDLRHMLCLSDMDVHASFKSESRTNFLTMIIDTRGIFPQDLCATLFPLSIS